MARRGLISKGGHMAEQDQQQGKIEEMYPREIGLLAMKFHPAAVAEMIAETRDNPEHALWHTVEALRGMNG